MLWRDAAIVVVTLVLGPPIASLVVLLGSGIGQFGLAALLAFDVLFYLASLPFAYFLAAVPSLIAAGCNVVAGRFVDGETWRLMLALPFGALPFFVLLGWLAEEQSGGWNRGDFVSIGLGGALASFISLALVEAFWSKPRQSA